MLQSPLTHQKNIDATDVNMERKRNLLQHNFLFFWSALFLMEWSCYMLCMKQYVNTGFAFDTHWVLKPIRGCWLSLWVTDQDKGLPAFWELCALLFLLCLKTAVFVSWTRHLRTTTRRLPTKGILDCSVPPACAFSLIIPFVAFLPSLFLFSSDAICPSCSHYIGRPLPRCSPPSFTLQNNRQTSPSLGFGQMEPERRRDLSGAQISTSYTLLALLSEGRGRNRLGENIPSISRILAARQSLNLPAIKASAPVWASAIINDFTSASAFIWSWQPVWPWPHGLTVVVVPVSQLEARAENKTVLMLKSDIMETPTTTTAHLPCVYSLSLKFNTNTIVLALQFG